MNDGMLLDLLAENKRLREYQDILVRERNEAWAEVSRLREELAHERSALRERIRQLQEELTATQRDAERYRWLRKQMYYIDGVESANGLTYYIRSWYLDCNDFTSTTVEDMIDAAMAQEKRESALDRMADDARESGVSVDKEERDERT